MWPWESSDKEQYCKIILFYKFLSNETDIFRELLQNTTDSLCLCLCLSVSLSHGKLSLNLY